MNVGNIFLTRRFLKQHRALHPRIKRQLAEALDQFRKNPLHPSLRLHKLSGKMKGCWSISINEQYRAVFEPLKDSDVTFLSVGTHAIYE